MFISIFDLFKIGIGPSSSHTMGPMIAANKFVEELNSNIYPKSINTNPDRIRVTLYGSLAYTGIGHATDIAIILGLLEYKPDSINPDDINNIISNIKTNNKINQYNFNPSKDIIFAKGKTMPGHANGLQFEALDKDNNLILRRGYYSIGGGFIVREEELAVKTFYKPEIPEFHTIPYPFRNTKELLKLSEDNNLTIAELKEANELVYKTKEELYSGIDNIYNTMSNCINRGLSQEGILPGGLNVKRRAKDIYTKLKESNPLSQNDWLAVYAIAVNEENASGGKVVTAPTNGAAGVIPSVLKYYLEFINSNSKEQSIRNFLLTASAIGGIIKRNASISGAEVGCQGEVGVASSMAAAGLTSVLGGTSRQIENAAEIALEHHLGMTCDPVKGLVQVPCIERNAMGAIKALSATSLSLYGDGTHFISLDSCIEAMRQTGLDMNEKYKETSEGGLAINYANC